MPGPEIEFHEPVRSGGPGRVSASRFGILATAAALMIVGVVAVMAAAPSSATGADPSAAANPNASAAPAASGAPGPGKDGNDGGHPGFRGPFGLFGPSGGFGGGPDGGVGGIGFGDITITAIDGSNLSLKTADGWTRTIAVTGATTITKAEKSIGVGDLAVGDHIRFAQQRDSNGTYTVTRIVVVLPTVAGQVSAVSGDTITVTQRGGTKATIHVDSSTTYQVNGTSGSLKDVKVGSVVIAEGTQRSDGSLDAAIVHTGDRPAAGQGPTWKHENGANPGGAKPGPSSGTS